MRNFYLLFVVACLNVSTLVHAEPPGETSAVDRILLYIDNKGELQDVAGDRIQAIAKRVSTELAHAGYDVSSVEGSSQRIKMLVESKTRDSALMDEYAYLLHVTVNPIRNKKTPIGLSLSLGNSDPRAREFQKADVMPVHCALLNLDDFREEGSLIQDKSAPTQVGESPLDKEGYAQIYSDKIYSVCQALLAKLGTPRKSTDYAYSGSRIRVETSYISDEPQQTPVPRDIRSGESGAKVTATSNESASKQILPKANAEDLYEKDSPSIAHSVATDPDITREQSTISTEHTQDSRKRKQIKILNQGNTVILEFGNNRRY